MLVGFKKSRNEPTYCKASHPAQVSTARRRGRGRRRGIKACGAQGDQGRGGLATLSGRLEPGHEGPRRLSRGATRVAAPRDASSTSALAP
eukprot:42148-Rhodomonas_salina.1